MNLPKNMPNKLYYSISEVAEMTGVKAHVLRYWESEFPELRPKKNRAGNRSYQDKDIGMVTTIRDLLYREGFTIQGARLQLKDRGRKEDGVRQTAAAEQVVAKAAARLDNDFLRTVKSELRELRKRLD